MTVSNRDLKRARKDLERATPRGFLSIRQHSLAYRVTQALAQAANELSRISKEGHGEPVQSADSSG